MIDARLEEELKKENNNPPPGASQSWGRMG
jgi:hypothetical protein